MNKIIQAKIAETIYEVNSDLQILYFALQTLDEDIELASILNIVERDYKKINELNSIIIENLL